MLMIEQTLKNALLNWKDTEPIFKQFEEKLEKISELFEVSLDPYAYQSQYETHLDSLATYMKLQNEIAEKLHIANPELQFGIAGRLKSFSSYYEKIIRKYIELLEKDEFKKEEFGTNKKFKPIEIHDLYAFKVFLLSLRYPISKVSMDGEGIYIDCGSKEFRINDKDCFEFSLDNGKSITVPVKSFKVNAKKNADEAINGIMGNEVPALKETNIFVEQNRSYIKYTDPNTNQNIKLALKDATHYIRSNKGILIPNCYKFQPKIVQILNEHKFEVLKEKDYYENPKPSGYSSLQVSLFNKEEGLSMEFQLRHYDMERFILFEREIRL